MASEIRFGLMNRGQFNYGDDLPTRFGEMLEQARVADRLGFDSLMKGSHFSTYPLHDFNQVVFLSRMMTECPNLRLLAGIVLLPLHKPLEVAEQFANIDLMSGGRLIFGVGLGYRDVEFAAFGIERRTAPRHLERNLEAIKRLWAEERVTMKGDGWELIEANCSVKPVQRPRPPIWIGANADKAIERAARIADAWFVSPHNRIDTTTRQLELYRRALDAAGKPFPDEFPMMREVVVARSREEAIRLAEPYLMAKYEAYHAWGQDKVMPAGDNDFGVAYDELVKDRFLFGSPDEVSEQIIDLVKRFGVNNFVMGVQFPGMPQSMVLDEMHMLAEEVFPKVRQAV
jgi:alkanesulfonate monooxygenase SsuD/methylene tetrahydromethanopterin reductase-like flavin-dependent oxidoreductase (luciferase family)